MNREPSLSDIEVSRDRGTMGLSWDDGLSQEVRLDDLRRLCPCAVCEGNRAAQTTDKLHMITADELGASDGVRDVIPVGRYAIQIRWEDGHDTGIFTYKYLRSLGTAVS